MIELLAPAGSMDALEAAVSAGADAVYFGGQHFNARAMGTNFSDEALINAIRYCRLRNVKTYITLNTLLRDEELKTLDPFIALLCDAGADGVIVQDLGLAHLLRQAAPSLPLHASTQMTIHSSDGVLAAKELGFSRAVVARELPKRDLAYICAHSPIEIEAFIHGALCMCHSGQCYLSGVIGERNGNRGSCAQPCRKCYQNGYELSLKDLCMAQDFVSFLECGVTSLKIEGRLKSPEYVGGVTSIYRRLIDEQRNATKEELAYLAALFSRQGFTNGYFTEKKGKSMFGVRTEQDKALSKGVDALRLPEKKMPVAMRAIFDANTASLSVTSGQFSETVQGDAPQAARTVGTTKADVEKQLGKTGGTPFFAASFDVSLAPDLFLPVSALNALRRSALGKLEQAILQAGQKQAAPFIFPTASNAPAPDRPKTYLHFFSFALAKAALPYLKDADMLWLPAEQIKENLLGKTSAVLPPVLFDHEKAALVKTLQDIKALGITDLLCHTVGQIRLANENGFTPHASPRLNAANSASMYVLDRLGCKDAAVSWEIPLKQLKALKSPLPLTFPIYGRQPVMITENCIIQNAGDCLHHDGFYSLKDQTGRAFPVFCAEGHRNQIFNAEPLYLADKLPDFLSLAPFALDYFFTTESPQEIAQIIKAYQTQAPSDRPFTRGAYYKK